jgi:hypothetical protein
VSSFENHKRDFVTKKRAFSGSQPSTTSTTTTTVSAPVTSAKILHVVFTNGVIDGDTTLFVFNVYIPIHINVFSFRVGNYTTLECANECIIATTPVCRMFSIDLVSNECVLSSRVLALHTPSLTATVWSLA